MIQNLYERFTELLGKPENDPLFAALLKDLGESPKLEDEIAFRIYHFAASGFHVNFSALYDCFSEIRFSIRPFFAEEPYKGNFPADILTSDTSDSVQSKLARTPIRSGLSRGSRYTSDLHYDIYQLEHLELEFAFDVRTGVMRFAGLRFPGAQDRHEAISKFDNEHPEWHQQSET